MAYKSLFNPIKEEERVQFMRDHNISEDAFNQVNPAAVVNPASAQQPQPAPQQTNAPTQQPVQNQQMIVPDDIIMQLGPSIQKVCPGVTKDAAAMAAWNQFAKVSKSLNDLIGFITAFAQYAGNAIAQSQSQQTTQPVQAQQTQPVQNVSSSYKPALKGDRWALIREKARENMLKESQDDGSDDEKPAKPETENKSESKSGSSEKPSKSDEFHDDKHVDYSSEYDEEVSGKKGDTTVEYKDKVMYKSIFGTSEDPFQDDKDVNYHQSYDEIGDGETERPDNTTYTKPEPFKPENPKLTSLADASAVSKTVFTIDNGGVKDTGSSSEGKSKTIEDDGSENDDYTPKAANVDESFYTIYDSTLTESIESSLKNTIIHEFINEIGGDFDLGLFNDWIEEKYPKIASDPAAFDELVYGIQDHVDIKEDDEVEDEDIDNDDDLDIDDDFNSDETYTDIANEYLDDVDNDEYDEDDAIAWCEDNYPEIADNNDELDNFLDAVCNLYSNDDINESLNDEFYADESSIA